MIVDERMNTAPPRAATINDVAQLAGTSIATVSRVLSGSSYPVSAKARQRVLDAAEARGSAPGLIGLAINKAVKRSRRGPLESPAAYAITLLEDWAEQGLDSPEAVAEAKGDFSHYGG